MPSLVTEIPAAPSEMAAAHFAKRLSLETDCWDVHETLKSGTQDFVLLDVRGPAAFARGHLSGALNLPHGKITERRMADWPDGTLFVVYCAGPHCNGADRAALRLARIGRPVKLMIGGVTGWIDEGFALECES
jgi:rhodanese-related sulfurtransferase